MQWSKRDYLIAFNMINGIGVKRLQILCNFFGSIEKAWQSSAADLQKVPGFGVKLATAFVHQRKSIDPHQEIKWARAHHAVIITKYDQNYPSFLKQIYSPPPVIYCRGTLPSCQGIAIIGTRKPTREGREQAYHFARYLAGYDIPILSGLARGIDTQAHRGALSATGGTTVAVLATPINSIYPPENLQLAEQIATSGCLITEFSSRSVTRPGNFPRRNRIISGLAQGVLVVEAGEKSGTITTVDWALEQGKDVWAIPGSINHPLRKGTNKLIKQGAGLIDCPEDILHELDRFSHIKPKIKLDHLSQLVLKYYLQGISTEQIMELTELPLQKVQHYLTLLELEGLTDCSGKSCH